MKSLTSIRNCVGAGKFRTEVLENFAKDRNNLDDQEGGNRKRDADDDDRIGHGRFDFLAQSGGRFEESGQPVENFGEQDRHARPL